MATNNDIITRCPQCAIAFRATADVLKVANGIVRCGSCLKVFNAQEYIVEDLQQDKTPTPPKTTPNQDKLDSNNKHNNDEEDESWALELLKAEEDSHDIEEQEDYDVFELDDEPVIETDTKQPTKNNPADALFMDMMNNDLQEENGNNDAEVDIISELGLEIDDQNTDDIDQAVLLKNINPESVTLHETITPKKQWPWWLASAAAAIVLLAQIAWFRFDTLGTQEPYRQYYSHLCEVLNCELPTLSDLSQIRTTQLHMRNHPEEKSALIVDAIMINNASYQQRFPALQLEFRNIHGDTVARRAFQPHEYLRGDLTGATIMPPNQPIQLALSIVDPGESAINYHIHFIDAEANN